MSWQINKVYFKRITENPLSPKIDKSRLEQHIDRSLTELKHPLNDLPPRGCCSNLGGGTLPGEDSAVSKSQAAGSGLAPFSLHSQ